MNMETEASPKSLVTDWAKKHWQLLAAFTAGAFLGAIAVQQGYEGFRFGGAEYVLIKKASIPKSLSIQGKWFYETKTSGIPLQFDKLNCMSILGTADISQAAASNEFSINNATRRGCIDPESQVIKTNVGWRSINAAVLPDSRKIMVSLNTADPNPRIAYIEGAIPATISGDSPPQFDGTIYYLNTQNQRYGSTTITFCKEGSECAQDIARKLK
ncbi:hypothetical protein [Leptolyngbya sp. NIES-2104]|uniref:hypothetical protein n=1 Tax=Leptolyngbya sp. NIES-2104 TaxID=1552121 RepID=UPI00073EADA4|nr:hypothetical protein [Leptolyngbya sp. NIES-2104]